MNDLAPILSFFEPITLSEMDSIALMNRTDTKFIFSYNRLESILKQLSDQYRILDLNGVRASKYETLYYDTPDFGMYLDHHRKKPGRYKVRHRIYVDSNLNYFEVKFKNNKGRTIKNRVKKTANDLSIQGASEQLLNERTHYAAQNLSPKLWSNCSRITLANKFSKERLTLDVSLRFKNDVNEKKFPEIVIAEVKQEKLSASPFINVMKNERIRRGSFSKYCFGVVFLYNEVKKNNFKPKVLYINKIINHENNH